MRRRLAIGQYGDPSGLGDHVGPIDAAGHEIALTGRYGFYRGETCPPTWQTLIRWGDTAGNQRLWRARNAPMGTLVAGNGLIIQSSPCGDTRYSSDWYVDSSGRLGELRVRVGHPPRGVVADAVTQDEGPVGTRASGRHRTLLAERTGNTIWASDIPEQMTTGVLAQDATGRQWVLESPYETPVLSWSDDFGRTWDSRRVGVGLLYTDRTIGYLHARKITVSTDRATTWRTLPLPRLREAVPAGDRSRGWSRTDLVTKSGVLIIIYDSNPTLSPGRPADAVLVRSTNRAWTRFSPPRHIPPAEDRSVSINTLTGCDAERRCAISRDLGRTWHRIYLPY